MIYHHIVKRLESSTNYSSFLYCSAHLSDHVGALSWKNRTVRVIIDVFPLLNMQPNLSFSLIVSLFLTCWLPVFCVKNNARIKDIYTLLQKKRKHLYIFVFRILTSNQFFAYIFWILDDVFAYMFWIYLWFLY